VFFLCGLWHGASWTFVIWGLFHGTFLVLERLGLAALMNRLWRPVRHLYVLAVVMVGWVFFRADTLGSALAFLRAMAGGQPAAAAPFAAQWYLTPEVWLALIAGAVGSTPIVPAIGRWSERAVQSGQRALGGGVAIAGHAALAILLAASIMQSAARTYNPFIYFRF
jgi:alginate O-acetyltransferase complex protein AlgI